MRAVDDDLGIWLSKTKEHVELSKKAKPIHIALYFDDNLLN